MKIHSFLNFASLNSANFKASKSLWHKTGVGKSS